MEPPDALRLVDQQPGRPEVVAEVVAPRLELGGQAAVQDRQTLAAEQPAQRVAQSLSGPTISISPRLLGEWSKLMNKARRISRV